MGELGTLKFAIFSPMLCQSKMRAFQLHSTDGTTNHIVVTKDARIV